MKLIDPYPITDAVLVSSNVPETINEYDPEVTYGLGDYARDEATHTFYESLIVDSTDVPLSDESKWLSKGPTNRWGMLDGRLSTPTAQAEMIEKTFSYPDAVTGIALLGIEGASVQVVVTDVLEGEVFNNTYDLVSYDNVDDFWDWCFNPILRRTTFYIVGLPPYANATITIRIFAPGEVAKCAEYVMGQAIYLGETEWNFEVGIVSYAERIEDGFGGLKLLARPSRGKASFKAEIDPVLFDEVNRVLTERDGKPTVFIGTDRYSAGVTLGFARDWRLGQSNEAYALLSIDIESM